MKTTHLVILGCSLAVAAAQGGAEEDLFLDAADAAAAPAPAPVRHRARPSNPQSQRKAAAIAKAEKNDALAIYSDYDCPERNGLFPDPEQCDLYYVCEDGVAEPVLCDDGLLFDYSIRNREKCVLPHNVDCGRREYVQEPTPGIDARCPRANGFFDHEGETVCDKFYSCDKGVAFEMPCANPLFFDSNIGACVREEALSEGTKRCKKETELKEIDGFSCPAGPRIGPNGLRQEHPVYPHPADCRFFFTCYFGRDPNKFGCQEGQVFDEVTEVCKPAEEVRECACWYGCPDDCEECDPDCTCVTKK